MLSLGRLRFHPDQARINFFLNQASPILHTALGLPLPTAIVIDSFRDRPVHQPLCIPILSRPHQPTNQIYRPIRRRGSCTHHIPLPTLPNQRRPSSTHSSEPIPNSTRHQHIAPLFLPQRHLRLPNPSPRSTHTRKTPIPHRNSPPSNSHRLQDPPRPSSPSSHDLADPNPRPSQDPT